MRLIVRRLALYALTAWVAITVNFLLPHFMSLRKRSMPFDSLSEVG